MRVFQEKRRWRRRLFSKPALWGLFLAAVLLFFAAGREVLRAYRVSQERKSAEAKYRELQAEKAKLEERIYDLSTPEGAEKEAKKKWGAKKPGEEILVFVEPAPATSTPSAASLSRGFFDFIKNIFAR